MRIIIGPCRITIENNDLADRLEREVIALEAGGQWRNSGSRHIIRPRLHMQNDEPVEEKHGPGIEEEPEVKTISNKLIGEILLLQYPCALRKKERSKSSSLVAIHGELNRRWSGAGFDVVFIGYRLLSKEMLGSFGSPLHCDWQCYGLMKRDLMGKWTDALDAAGLGDGEFALRKGALYDSENRLIRKVAV